MIKQIKEFYLNYPNNKFYLVLMILSVYALPIILVFYYRCMNQQISFIDYIQKIASIVASSSIIIAILNYIENKEKQYVTSMFDSTSFFREKVLFEFDNFRKEAIKLNPEYTFPCIKLDDPKINIIRKNYPKECIEQINLLNQHPELQGLQIISLNLAEELALRIIYSKNTEHRAFQSIRPAFVSLVEMSAVCLLNQREITTGNKIYSATLELYEKWKDQVDRRSPEERKKEIMAS